MEYTPVTLYDENIHGHMTAEDRSRHNTELLRSIPERNEDDMYAHMQYKLLSSAGDNEGAERYKAGYERDLAWLQKEDEILRSRIMTKEEIKEMKHRIKDVNKMETRISKEAGLSKKALNQVVTMLDE